MNNGIEAENHIKVIPTTDRYKWYPDHRPLQVDHTINMEVKIALLIFAFISIEMIVDAELFYNHMQMTEAQLEERGLKCYPGHTVIKIEEKSKINTDDESEEEIRRSHMNFAAKEESCKICICSTEGKDEYCSRRPARNVNECLRMGILKKNMERNLPFEHERSLAFRIRRDYIWHNDEIPYEAKASCKRGTSYYSNNVNANDTDIDVPSDIDSLLDYSNRDICYYCVCATHGRHAGCISRDPWYCEYYRIIREPDAPRNRYHDLFQQDRPAYFRQLSYRLRRTMDDGVVAFMDVVNDDIDDVKCIPFVSEYSDCSEANSCSGCNRCVCSAEGEWRCESVFDCSVDDEDELSDRQTYSKAIDVLYSELKNKAKKKSNNFVPDPPKPEDALIVPDISRYEEDFATYVSRQKRSVKEQAGDKKNKNDTISFFHTEDEINEDTLKGTNQTGTISANKVAMKSIPKISRRSDLLDHFNKSDISPLQIEYNPQDYDHHITENKIESTPQAEGHLSIGKLRKIIGNYSQGVKNKDLSKLVVTELKHGTEVIGDKNVPPMSNITFTPENDTLTAMTFIAGNLLTKLWDMEKEATEKSTEIESIKHKKIIDLLELFKEPLSIRQETFLKNALIKLSDTLNKNKNVKNISLCETITDTDVSRDENSNKKDSEGGINMTNCGKAKLEKKQKEKDKQKNITTDVIHKLNNVLNLMKKFEHVQNSIKDLKHRSFEQTDDTNIDDATLSVEMKNDENSSLTLFGNLLEKITKLLIPNNASKKVTSRLKNLNQFNTNNNIRNVIENKFKIDLSNKNITIKDKLIFDYLNHIKNNPTCLLSQIRERKDERDINIEGGILYSLSDFFKIKSLFDLIKLTKAETVTTTETISTTKTYEEVTVPRDVMRDTPSKVISNVSQKLNITKEKLKGHLKAIIDDLIELQNENNPKSKSNINIFDALPCIYNILNADKLNNDQLLKKQSDADPLSKIKKLIDSLKIEFTSNTLTRRNNLASMERPRSAKIWERILKNVNNEQKQTRRSFNYKNPKTYQELKNIIEKVELAGNSYKNFALLSVVPPQKRLMLLKTLEADTKQSMFALKNIQDSLDILNKLTIDKQNEFIEFINNAENNINLSVKVLNNLETSKQKNVNDMVEVFAPNKYEANDKQTVQLPELNPKVITNYKSDDVKLTRDQILSLLIENRIKLYLATKEATNADLNNDINYNIAKRIISLLRQRNVSVAKELFKVFIANKREEEKRVDDSAPSKTTSYMKEKSPLLLALREPLIRFDNNAKKMQLKTPELLYTQLLNLKKIK